MKYQIGSYTLDVQARTLSDKDSCQHIRPKTLALLLYLAERSGQIVSKQELLDCVWDDVNVDDGVVFQSVREIRQLFSIPQIIQNYPRKGYEFTVSARPLSQDNTRHITSTVFVKYLLPFGLIVLAVWLVVSLSMEESAGPRYEESIVVLPMKNRIPYGENDWIYLGGMEQLIAKLKGLPSSIFVYQGTHIPHLMHTAGLARDFESTDVTKIFNVAGATLIVETEVHGNAHDYKLVYKFHVANDVKQGVILDSSINAALKTLSLKLATFINHPLRRSEDAPNKEFSDALFAEAMINYESDWQTSISFFESYLALNPDSVIASIYLSKLYLWSNRVEQASTLMEKAVEHVQGDPLEIAHVDLIKGRIAAQKQQWQYATKLYNQALETIDRHPDWFLKASIAEELGLVYLEQKLLDKSVQAFDSALAYHQIIQSPIGLNSTRLHLANVFFLKGNNKQASEYYLLAKRNIERAHLEFLYSMLADYEAKFETYQTINTE